MSEVVAGNLKTVVVATTVAAMAGGPFGMAAAMAAANQGFRAFSPYIGILQTAAEHNNVPFFDYLRDEHAFYRNDHVKLYEALWITFPSNTEKRYALHSIKRLLRYI